MYSLCVLCTNISTQYRTVQFFYMWFKGKVYFFPHSKCLSSFLFQFLASGTGFQDLGRIIFCIFFFLLKPVYIYPKNYSTVVFFFSLSLPEFVSQPQQRPILNLCFFLATVQAVAILLNHNIKCCCSCVLISVFMRAVLCVSCLITNHVKLSNF